MEKYDEWWASLPEKYREWVHGQGLNIRNKQHPTKLAYRCWKYQQAKIDELEQENKVLVEALEKYGNADNWSNQYLRQGRLGYQIKRELHEDGGKTARQVLAKIKKEGEG